MKKYHYISGLFFVFFIPKVIPGFYLADFVDLAALIPFILLVTIIGSIWDIWATRHGKKDRIWLWQFNRSQTLGLRLLDLPIEEYLFYVVSSVYVIFMWESLKLMLQESTRQAYGIVLLLS